MLRNQALYSYPVRNVPPVRSEVWGDDHYLYIAVNRLQVQAVTYPQEQAQKLPQDERIARHVRIPTECFGGAHKPLRRFIEIKQPEGSKLDVDHESIQQLRSLTDGLGMHWRLHRCARDAGPLVVARVSMNHPEQVSKVWSSEASLLQGEQLTFNVATADLVLAGLRALVGSMLQE